jgi:hypothetical protein
VNNKGKGAGPNGGKGFQPGGFAGPYIGELEFGSLSVMSLPFDETRGIHRGRAAQQSSGARPDAKLPPVKHVFFIIRENRSYDEVFGDLADADGDPTLARFGLHGWTEEAPKLNDVRVTPSAHALAHRFATSDRFFVDSDVSVDGHRWAFGIAPTPWLDMAWTSGYGGGATADPFSSAPGRRALGGGSDSPMPEDEPEYRIAMGARCGSGVEHPQLRRRD